MSFLSFRQAKRKAKKIVSIRSPRPQTPPTPGSFVSNAVVEIGDPSRPSAEAYFAPLTLHVDIGVKTEPFLPSDQFLAPSHDPASTTGPKQTKDRQSHRRSRSNGSIPKSLHDSPGSVQSRDGRLSEVEDITRTPGSRRATRLPPAPIKIPPTTYTSKAPIRRSTGKSTELRPASTNPARESPVADDGSSVVSGITLPGALITNVWTVHADQHHQQPSRRITRIDSAILPAGDHFTKSPTHRCSGTSTGDGEPLVPPLPPLPAGISGVASGPPASEQGEDNIASGNNLQTAEESGSQARDQPLTAPDEPSDTGTPDLMDSSTSAGGSSDNTQPDTSSSSDSAPSAWRRPVSRLSPISGEDLIMVLKFFPAPPSDHEFPIEAGVFVNERDLDAAMCSRALVVGPRRMCAAPDVRRRPDSRSRSSSHLSLADVNTLLLHPTTFGERRRSSVRSPRISTEDSQAVAPDGANNQSALPLAARRSQRISLLPYFPESAIRSSMLKSSRFPTSSRSSSSRPSPDLLDHFVLADESCMRRREQTNSHGSLSMMPGSMNGQTFPETPPAFSPMFSPGIDNTRAHKPTPQESSIRRHTSITRSLRGRGSRASQRLIVGRSASTKSPRMSLRKKSSSSNLRRSSTYNSISPRPSPHPTATKDDAFTTSGQARLSDDLPTRPRSLAGDHSPGIVQSRRLVLQSRSDFRRKTILLPVPFVLPPVPPSKPPSPQKTAVESPHPASPSTHSLPPPPPPPELHPPPQPARPRLSDVPPAEHSQALDLDRSLPPLPSPLPPVTPSSESLGAPQASPGHAPVNSLLNTDNIDRPRRPLGPRPPYRNASSSPKSRDPCIPSPTRDSFSRGTSTGGPSTSKPGPRFRTSPPKFKGLTMEAAKWTFSSGELQEIVSQAIRESAQASSIRLLSQQAAFVEIPDELEKLNTLLHELRVQYRLQVRKRDALMRATYAYAESPEFSSIALRSTLQELHTTTVTLDKIAEELYRVRDQVAQLSRMLAVHSGSALAMALRKLHSSYLKRQVELQSVQDHVHALETERDEAWAQAQQVARDLDDLNDTLQSQDPSPPVTRSTSRRSSRVVASRKSYQHVSRAGLRLSVNKPASLGSQISSAVCTPSSASGPIPPVPPIPHRPSLGLIITSDLPNQSSACVSDLSSSSARRALTRAEADLYGYLGIDDPELMSLPRRRSSIAVSPSTLSPLARDMASRRMSDIITDRRLTRGCALSDRIQASMEDESDALLNTFHHLDP